MIERIDNDAFKRALRSAEICQRVLSEALRSAGDLTETEFLDGMLTIVLASKQAIEGPKSVAHSLWLVAGMMAAADDNGPALKAKH